jgi:hypothetical protein
VGVLQDAYQANTIFLGAIIYEVNKSLLSHFSTRAPWPASLPLLANFSANKISHLPSFLRQRWKSRCVSNFSQTSTINNRISRPVRVLKNILASNETHLVWIFIADDLHLSKDVAWSDIGGCGYNKIEMRKKEGNKFSLNPGANKPPLSLTSGICPFLS